MMQDLEATGKLDHMGLIRSIACYSDKEHPILIFPFWNGGTLKQMFKLKARMENPEERPRIPLTQIEQARVKLFQSKQMYLGKALLQILNHMHKQKIFYYDLYAHNILLHFPK